MEVPLELVCGCICGDTVHVAENRFVLGQDHHQQTIMARLDVGAEKNRSLNEPGPGGSANAKTGAASVQVKLMIGAGRVTDSQCWLRGV